MALTLWHINVCFTWFIGQHCQENLRNPWVNQLYSQPLKAIKQNSKISWEHTPDITPEDKNIWMAFSVIPKTKTGQFPSCNDNTVKKEFPWLSSPPQMDLLQKPNHETQKWISSHSFLALGLVPVNHVWAIPWTVPNRSRLPWRARRTMLKNKWPAKPKRPRARGQKWPAPTTGPLWEIESQWKTRWSCCMHLRKLKDGVQQQQELREKT